MNIGRVRRRVARLQADRWLNSYNQHAIASFRSNDERAFAGVSAKLNVNSLLLCQARQTPSSPRLVNLVLPEISAGSLFAGIDTALRFAGGLAERIGIGLRIVALNHGVSPRLARSLMGEVRARISEDVHVEVVGREALRDLRASPTDVWIGTYWTTARALDVAAQAGAVSADRVIYLVQDYEPGFFPWCTDHAVARSTYHAGFHIVVNSSPLAAYLDIEEGISLPPGRVFRPQVSVPETGEQSTPARTPGTARILFYGRPSKPRNMFDLGVAALQKFASTPDRPTSVELFSVGEPHPDVALGSGLVLRSLGRLSWPDYFALLQGSDVLLSLQQSPHPSHPPLDACVRGTFAVTNELAGTRGQLSPLLAAVDARPGDLASALSSALRQVERGGRPPGDHAILERLGVVLDATLDDLSERFR